MNWSEILLIAAKVLNFRVTRNVWFNSFILRIICPRSAVIWRITQLIEDSLGIVEK